MNKIEETKEEYYAKMRETESNGNRLKASIAMNVSGIVRLAFENRK